MENVEMPKFRIFLLLLLCGSVFTAEAQVRRVCTWAVLGPFIPTVGDGYDEDFLSGESGVLPEIDGVLAGKTWAYFDDREYCRNQDDYNDLYTYFMDSRPGGPGGGTENRVAYCGTYVWSATSRNLRLRFGANDKAKVWLNGVLVHQQATESMAQRDASNVEVTLNPGWNRLLVKVVNIRRIWGFYLNLTTAFGTGVTGLEYTPYRPDPGGPLAVVTPAFPDAYRTQPYVWLDVTNPGGSYPANNPSASPFRLCGRGGTPPYSWEVSGLPSGITFDGSEGEFRGAPAHVGTYPVTITLRDSATPQSSATVSMSLNVRPRVTEEWWETGSRLCGIRHNIASPFGWRFDHLEEQATLLSRMGYSWTGYSIMSAKTVNYSVTPPTVTIFNHCHPIGADFPL